jgi:hypothetical protein
MELNKMKANEMSNPPKPTTLLTHGISEGNKAAEQREQFPNFNLIPCMTLCFTYINHKGRISRRRALFQYLFHGTTRWHTEPQFFFAMIDLDKCKERFFSVKDMTEVREV